MIKRALISVSDKTGVLEFAVELQKLGVEIISTGGTYKYLSDNGLSVEEVANITNFPEILDGRVKTLHPIIHGGILGKRDNDSHKKQMVEHGIIDIDLVCVNLYPFEETISKDNVQLDYAIENIDIGGPAMIRAAAKNYNHVIILTSSRDYMYIVGELKSTGFIQPDTRIKLAQKAFSHTSYYDGIIANYFNKQAVSNLTKFNEELTIPARLVQTLRYGENSHQEAAFYKDAGDINGLLASFKQLQGKELSYNNLVDSDAAWECVRQFSATACAIVKHANPCGVALSVTTLDAYKKAFASDPISSFGGIIAFNSKVDVNTANELNKQFVEVLIAPEYEIEALNILSKKTNLRVLQINLIKKTNVLDYKRIGGGVLIQTLESKNLSFDELVQVSNTPPTQTQKEDLLFAWNVARFVKSNAIVLVKDKQTIGIGAGQMSRIDSTKIAKSNARDFGFEVKGSVCASDAFFPFRDNVDILAGCEVGGIIHPGGSIKDKEVFAAADERGIAMLITRFRAFRH